MTLQKVCFISQITNLGSSFFSFCFLFAGAGGLGGSSENLYRMLERLHCLLHT